MTSNVQSQSEESTFLDRMTQLIRERPALACYLAAIATIPLMRPPLLPFGSTSVQSLQLSDCFLALAFVLASVDLIRNRHRFVGRALIVVSILYLLVLASSILVSGASKLSAVKKLVAYSALVLTPVLTVNVLRSREDLSLAVRAWLLGTAGTTAIGLATVVVYYLDQHGLGQSLTCTYAAVLPVNLPRLCVPFRLQNLLANYLVFSLPLCWLVGFELVGRRLAVVGAILFGVVLLLTFSTGVGGAALALLIVYNWTRLRPRRRSVRWLISVGALGIAVFMAVATVSTLERRDPPGGQGRTLTVRFWNSSRTSVWRASWQTVLEHPWLGRGYSQLVALVDDPRAFIPPHRRRTLRGPVQPHWMEAHNIWLSVAGQSGLVGLAAFCLLVAAIVRSSIADLSWRSGSGPEHDLRMALFAGMLGGFGYHGLFGAFEEARHFWAFLGLAVAAGQLYRTVSSFGLTEPNHSQK